MIMKGIIYKLTDKETREVYIGSTMRPLKFRIYQHRGQTGCAAHSIVVRNNYKIEILEEINFKNTAEKLLKICEQKHMDNTPNIINKQRAIGSTVDKEYYRRYYQNNKEKYASKNEQRRLNYAFKKTWGDDTTNLLDIKNDVFMF